jgi:hypothetical protein
VKNVDMASVAMPASRLNSTDESFSAIDHISFSLNPSIVKTIAAYRYL